MEKRNSLTGILFLFSLFVIFATYLTFSKTDNQTVTAQSATNPTTTQIAAGLNVPWSLVFLPNGNLLVTERGGTLKILDKANGSVIASQKIANVKAIAEGGLLGATLHPNFASNNYIYLYYTYSSNGNNTLNRVSRYTFTNNQLFNEAILVDAIPGGSYHNGGRIKFGPDSLLYIGTGDAGNPSSAQDKNSLAGKILRVTDAGQAAPGNPFTNRTYSYGHRNPQGLTWNGTTMYATEHGQSAMDEVNLIEAGKNYGWPTIQGDQTGNGMVTPLRHSASDTWAPSGTAFYNGSLFFSGLRGQALYEAQLQGTTITLKTHFKNQFGRIRDAVVGPDNALYIVNNNTNDDKILKINFGTTVPSGIVPTFGCMGSPSSICPTTPITQNPNPSGSQTPPPSNNPSPAPSISPCEAGTFGVLHNKGNGKKKHVKKKKGAIGKGTNALLRFLLEFINLLLRLIGGGDRIIVPPTDPCEEELGTSQPAPSEIPNNGEEPLSPTQMIPSPSQ